MAWYDGVAESSFEVDCEGQRHTICWSRGEVSLTHPDIHAEKSLVALGGRNLDVWRYSSCGNLPFPTEGLLKNGRLGMKLTTKDAGG